MRKKWNTQRQLRQPRGRHPGQGALLWARRSSRDLEIKIIYFGVLILFITVTVVTFIYCKKPSPATAIKQVRYKDLTHAAIPPALKNFLLQKPGSELNLVHFDGKKLRYHEEARGDLFMKLCLDAMQQIATSSQLTLLPGYYLLSFRDGVHENFARPWPVLAFASSKDLVANKEVFLIPDYEAMQGYQTVFAAIDNKLQQYPWDAKQAKIFWRGVPSGTKYNNFDINGSPRLRFMNIASKYKFADVGLTAAPGTANMEFNNKILALHPLKQRVAPEDAIAFKYLIDVDGISCSFSRMAWILYSNSVLMKYQSDKIQWYYDKLQAYVNFIPIAEDFSDLQQQFNWAQTHQQQAQQIANNGRELAQQVFTQDAILHSFAEALVIYQKTMRDVIKQYDD